MLIDLRSDTVTKPTGEMREAMHFTKVGDDVFGEDPAINNLEALGASMFGMESAVFCPSGTMTNQIAIKCHTQPGDEVICDEMSHVYQYEGGGIAFNSGASVKLLHGDRGRVTAQLVAEGIQPDDVHRPISRLVVLENTANRGGGSCYDLATIQEIGQMCKQRGLSFHLDGARLFNALVATGQSAMDYGASFDSISICLSKGLGAPVGSLLLGKQDFIKKARRFRKVFGGGMRQAGSLAAAGTFALQHNISRLQDDHDNAKAIEKILSKLSYIKGIMPVETNIVIANCVQGFDVPAFVQKMKADGILFFAISPTAFRMVTHLDFTADMLNPLEKSLKTIN
ncbi:MAG: low-specificity L-threonine aldolase [Bacteroidota bacterium]|jgi:threonine aldolase